jgi:hypothetical protein
VLEISADSRLLAVEPGTMLSCFSTVVFAVGVDAVLEISPDSRLLAVEAGTILS